MMARRSASILGLLSIFLLGASCDSAPDSDTSPVAGLDKVFSMDTLSIENSDGSRHELDVYLAVHPDQHRQGLMHVRHMPEDVGMLFAYPRSAVHSMWMKNTHIPLDIVFALADGTVSSIIKNTTPFSLKSLSSEVPVTYVLELNAGSAERLGIETTSRIVWKGLED